jgi:exodeoxyribonuclease VII small subunit
LYNGKGFYARRKYGGRVASLKFEEALSRLEEAVKSLEKGDLPLDDSLRVFEEGIRLSKSCLKILEEAEKKVEILIQDKEGRKKGRPLDLKGVASEEPSRDPAAGPAADPEGTSSHV